MSAETRAFEGTGLYVVLAEGAATTDLGFAEVEGLLERSSDHRIRETERHQNGLALEVEPMLSPEHIARMLGLTGYVSYAGRILLMRPWYEVSERDILEAVFPPDTEKAPVRLITLTHEGFPDRWPYDRDGILRSRFYGEKFHFGRDPASHVFKRIASGQDPWSELPIELIRGREDAIRLRESGETEPYPRTLMLIQAIAPGGSGQAYPGRDDRHLLVLMESDLSARNIVHMFDDNKPFWPERHTTPPRLVAAAINLLGIHLPWDRQEDPAPTLLDPFVGTGTTVLEALKHPVDIEVGDRDDIAGLTFNLDFFLTFDDETLDEFREAVDAHVVRATSPFLRELCEILSHFFGGGPSFTTPRCAHRDGAVDVTLTRFLSVLTDDNPLPETPEVLASFEPGSVVGSESRRTALQDTILRFRRRWGEDRLSRRCLQHLVYMAYRVTKDRYPWVTDSIHYVDPALLREGMCDSWDRPDRGGNLSRMLRTLREEWLPRREESTAAALTGMPLQVRRIPRQRVLYAPRTLDWSSAVRIHGCDLIEAHRQQAFPYRTFDFLFTDVPYAFNTPVEDMDVLHDAFLALLTEKSHAGSRAVLVALDRVKSGQRVESVCFARHLVRRMEDETPFDLVSQHYWKSPKALNRKILVFGRKS